MERRHLLKIAPALLAGCLSGRRAKPPTPSSRTPTSPPTAQAGEPTVRSTTKPTLGDAATVVPHGQWVTGDRYAFAVSGDFDVITTLQDTFHDRSVEMPAGKQLTTTDVRVKNITQREQSPPGQFTHAFAFLAGDDSYEHTGTISHPAYDDTFDLDWLLKADAYQRYPGFGSELTSGAVHRYWLAFVTPRGIDLSSAQVGLSTGSDGYPFRWGKRT